MSSRVTRSSAKHPASSPPPATTIDLPIPPPSASKKRKASAAKAAHDPDIPAETPSSPRPKRRKKSQPAAPVKSRSTNMSSSPPRHNHSDDAHSAPTVNTPSTSKKKAHKSKKLSASDQPSSASKPKHTTSAKKHSPGSKKGAIAEQDPDLDSPGHVSSARGSQDDEDDVSPHHDDDDDDDDEEDEDDDDDDDDDDVDAVGLDDEMFMRSAFPGGHGALAAMRAMAGMVSGMSSRLRLLLDDLRRKDDPSVQLTALTDLSDMLLVSTEDNLAGHFSPDQYVKELVVLMQSPDDGSDGNPEIMTTACRCIANLIEALPSATATVVYNGAVPVLVEKLLNIMYVDLAEQAITTLEKISVEFPASIVREGGLSACLQFLDFFPTAVQRTAVTTAANCCRNIPDDSLAVVKDVMPNLLNVLSSNDQRVVEQGSLCISRIVDSFKYDDASLEDIMNADILRAVLRLLLPGSTNLVSAHIHTQFLRVLSIVARASPSLAGELFKMNVTDTLYQILTGVSPPSDDGNVAQKIDSVMVMQALIHRPRDQVFESLNVICELLPGLDKAGLGFINDLAELAGRQSDVAISKSDKAPISKRKEILSTCKDELRRFATILLPTLTDAFSSTVNVGVRQRVLTAQLKMLSNLDQDILENALKPVPYASFLASILSQPEHPFLVTSALQAADLLLKRLANVYCYQFYREGVIAEIRKLADRPLDSSAPKAKPQAAEVPAVSVTESRLAEEAAQGDDDMEEDRSEDDEETGENETDDDDDDDEAASDGSSDGHAAIDPQLSISKKDESFKDVLTKFAKQFIARCEADEGSELRHKASRILDDLNMLVSQIADCYDGGRLEDGAKLFAKMAESFEGNALESITSYELLSSNVVHTLLDVFDPSKTDASVEARAAFVKTFMSTPSQSSMRTSSSASPSTPFSILVQKLQDLLSRAEHFEVVTVNSSPGDSNRGSAASMLAKQVRIKLVADGDESGIPAPFRQIMVSIHAIATLKALDEYLRPRMNLGERSRPSRFRDASSASSPSGKPSLPGMFAPEELLSRRLASTPAPPQGSLPPAAPRSASGLKTPQLQQGGEAHSRIDSDTKPGQPESTPTGRRTNRKSKTRPAVAPSTPTPAPGASDVMSETEHTLECADEERLSDGGAMDEDEDIDAVIDEFEEEIEDDDEDPSAVSMEVGSTGKVTARQDDGTRIATPTHTPTPTPASAGHPGRALPSSIARSLFAMNRPMSYSAAIRSTPTDWHLEFSVNGNPISSDTTVYRAIHANKAPSDDSTHRSVWSNVHSIGFKKVSGPPPEASELSPTAASPTLGDSGLPQSLDQNPTTAAILRLLHILHETNANIDDVIGEERSSTKIYSEPLAQFVNTKLTAKMNRQLEEPLIVASNSLPSWSEDLARLYPFLFPFETRHLFLQSTSYGYSRSITRWQNAQSHQETSRHRHRDDRPFLGRLQRQKVRISRLRILESAIKVMELYGASPSILEVEYFEEVGTGLGPTLEFYSSVSKEFTSKRLQLWRQNETPQAGEYAFGKRGLFPAPMSAKQASEDNGQRILVLFRMLGKFMARSMLDSRIIDLYLNPTFFRANAGANSLPLTLAAVKSVDEDLANSLQTLKQFAMAKKRIMEQRVSPSQKAQKVSRIQVHGASIDDMGLDFTLPGYPSIELVDNGSNKVVNIDNVDLYIDKVVEFTLRTGIRRQLEAFQTGFSQVFPYTALRAFTPEELCMLFGHTDEDWSIETLMDSIKADHGYNLDSAAVRNLLQVMSELDGQERRDFLQFVTGSPKLPIGGFKSLTPMFTVVSRPAEPGHAPDEYLPSCMTCVNYLKMPNYSTLEIMRKKMALATREGQGAFHLS